MTNSDQISPWLIKGVLFLIVFCLFIFFYRRSKNKKTMNKTIFVLHLIVLGLFFTNRLDTLSHILFDIGVFYIVFDVIFDVLWWSMSGVGVICCIHLLKERSKQSFFLILTTLIFLAFIIPMMALTNM